MCTYIYAHINVYTHRCVYICTCVPNIHVYTIYTYTYKQTHRPMYIYMHVQHDINMCVCVKFWVVFQIFLVKFCSLLLFSHTFNTIFYFLKHIKHLYFMFYIWWLYTFSFLHTWDCSLLAFPHVLSPCVFIVFFIVNCVPWYFTSVILWGLDLKFLQIRFDYLSSRH